MFCAFRVKNNDERIGTGETNKVFRYNKIQTLAFKIRNLKPLIFRGTRDLLNPSTLGKSPEIQALISMSFNYKTSYQFVLEDLYLVK